MIDLGEILLRKLEPHDLDQLYIYRNSPETLALLSRFSIGLSRADLACWLDFHLEQKDEVLLAIVEAKTNRCIGQVGLYQIDHRVGKAEFGILIGDSSWLSRGVGRRVSEALFSLAFDQLNLQRIWIEILGTNPRSLAVYHRLGFQAEGTLRNHDFRDGRYVDCSRMALLRSEWQELKSATSQ